MKRILLSLGFLIALCGSSFAACAVTNLTVKDAAGSPVTALVPYADDGSGGSNCSPQIQIKQGGNVANVDSNHGLLVDPASAAAWNTTWAGGTLGAMANYGTSPGAVLVPGMNAAITNIPAVTQSGAWNVGGAASAPVTMQNAATANGNGTVLAVANYSSAFVNVNCSVACSGGTTINFEFTDSTGTFFSLLAFPIAGGAQVTTATTSGQFIIPLNAGMVSIRARISGYSAGTITVTGIASASPMSGISYVPNTNGNGQATMANSSPVTLPSNQSVADPCMFQLKSSAPINLTASGQIITGTSAKKTYICALDIMTATAQNIALVEGTGTTCATNIFGLAGGTTAATGWNFSANGGLTKGNGSGQVYYGSGDANAAAANVCLLLSSTGQTSGSMQYVQQ